MSEEANFRAQVEYVLFDMDGATIPFMYWGKD